MLLLLALIATTHGFFWGDGSTAYDSYYKPVSVEADYEWELDVELNDIVSLDNDIDDISNLVEEVNEIGEDWIWENLPYNADSDNEEPVDTTSPTAGPPPTTESDLPSTPDTTPGFKSIACFFSRFFPTGASKPAPTPTLAPSKPVTFDIMIPKTAEPKTVEGQVPTEDDSTASPTVTFESFTNYTEPERRENKTGSVPMRKMRIHDEINWTGPSTPDGPARKITEAVEERMVTDEPTYITNYTEPERIGNKTGSVPMRVVEERMITDDFDLWRLQGKPSNYRDSDDFHGPHTHDADHTEKITIGPHTHQKVEETTVPVIEEDLTTEAVTEEHPTTEAMKTTAHQTTFRCNTHRHSTKPATEADPTTTPVEEAHPTTEGPMEEEDPTTKPLVDEAYLKDGPITTYQAVDPTPSPTPIVDPTPSPTPIVDPTPVECFFDKFDPSGSSAPVVVPTTEVKIEDGPLVPTFLIKLCKNPHYKPPCVYVTESTPQLSDLDDEISSIKVFEGTWVLYTGSNYTGERSWVRAGYRHPWLGVLKAEQGAQLELRNDDLSSLRMNPYSNDTEGLIMLCENDRYNPPCINVTQDTPHLALLNNEISSIKVIKGTWQLFTGDDYSGSKYWVSEGYEHPWLGVLQPDQGRVISLGDDKLSSLRAHVHHEH